MFHSIMFLVLSATQYGSFQAHNDSLYIYNAYTASAKVFEAGTDANQWKTLSDSVNKATEAAMARLNQYNKENYAPVDELNKEGLGSALVFPKPGEFVAANNQPITTSAGTNTNAPVITGSNETTKEIAFKVLDEQTHFLIGPNGKGRIPYIVMNYYAKGRILVKSEKLNPVTHQPIQIPADAAAGPALSAN